MNCIICKAQIEEPEVYGPLFALQCRECWVAVGLNSTTDLEDFNQALDLYGEEARDHGFLKGFLREAQGERYGF